MIWSWSASRSRDRRPLARRSTRRSAFVTTARPKRACAFTIVTHLVAARDVKLRPDAATTQLSLDLPAGQARHA